MFYVGISHFGNVLASICSCLHSYACSLSLFVSMLLFYDNLIEIIEKFFTDRTGCNSVFIQANVNKTSMGLGNTQLCSSKWHFQ